MLKSIFSVNRKALKETISDIKNNSKKFIKTGICKISVFPTYVELSAQGFTRNLHAKANGSCELYIPFRVLYAYVTVNSASTDEILFEVSPGTLICDGSTLKLDQIKVEEIALLSGIELSFKANDFELLQAGSKFSSAEITKHNLDDKIKAAKKRLTENVNEAYEVLKIYKITMKDIELIISNKLNL